jgi:hypothetical protein
MKPHEPPDVLLGALRARAAAFAMLLAGHDRATWLRRPAPGEWSLTEIACHLRDVEREVHAVRLERVAAQEGVFIPAADTDQYAQQRDYQAQDGPAALADFVAARAALVGELARAPAELWERTARHALFGTTSFGELVSLMVDHDDAHLEQIRAVLGLPS